MYLENHKHFSNNILFLSLDYRQQNVKKTLHFAFVCHSNGGNSCNKVFLFHLFCSTFLSNLLLNPKLKNQMLSKCPRGGADFMLHFKRAFINACLFFLSFFFTVFKTHFLKRLLTSRHTFP